MAEYMIPLKYQEDFKWDEMASNPLTEAELRALLDLHLPPNSLLPVEYTPKDIFRLLYMSRNIFSEEPTLLDLCPENEITIVGDLFGNFGQLLAIFSECGWPPGQQFLFLGNYIDRGPRSMETIILLLVLKNLYPNSVFMLRGSHECAHINVEYGFLKELYRRKYHSNDTESLSLYDTFNDVFDYLPIAARIHRSLFAVHSGISASAPYLMDIKAIPRPNRNPMEHGPVCDLLYNEPTTGVSSWSRSPRGYGYRFGVAEVKNFCQKNKIKLIVRSKQVVKQGFMFMFDYRLVCLFSVPNYCNLSNQGAVMKVYADVRDEKLKIGFEAYTYHKYDYMVKYDTNPSPNPFSLMAPRTEQQGSRTPEEEEDSVEPSTGRRTGKD